MKSEELLKTVIEAADAKRAEDIVALDVREVSLLADYFVVMQANSNRQVKAIAENIEEHVEKNGNSIRDIEGKDAANWILLDAGDVIINIFKDETRAFYNLEKLWSQAKLVNISDWVKE